MALPADYFCIWPCWNSQDIRISEACEMSRYKWILELERLWILGCRSLLDEGGRAGWVSSMMWSEWSSTLYEMIKEEGEEGSTVVVTPLPPKNWFSSMKPCWPIPLGMKWWQLKVGSSRDPGPPSVQACYRGWQPQGLGGVALELAWLDFSLHWDQGGAVLQNFSLGQLLTLCSSSRTAHTLGVVKLSFVLQYAFTLPAYPCTGKWERSLAEDLVLLTRDHLGTTPAPTQELLAGTCFAPLPFMWGRTDFWRGGLKGSMDRPLRPLVLQSAFILFLPFFFPFCLNLAGSKRFLVCIADWLSLSLLEGCELLWNPARVGPDSTVLNFASLLYL